MARAVAMGRAAEPGADYLYWAAQFLPYVVSAAVLLAPSTAARVRVAVSVLVAVLPAILWRLIDPYGVVAFDEQLHLRTLNDLLNGAPLFSPNPLLAVSSYYPGMETATAFVAMTTGLSAAAAITVVLVASRAALALGIYGLGMVLTRSSRAAALAVLVYACSPQFQVFNSQFSYQSMALPLGVCSVYLLHRAQRATTKRAWLFAAAMVCLVATVFVHHLTGMVMVVSVVGWAAWATIVRLLVAARHRAPIRPALAGMGVWGAAAVLGTVVLAAWTAHVSANLSDYLAGIFGTTATQFAGVFSGGETRQFFADDGGTTSPLAEKLTLYAYAALWALLALWAGLALLRHAVRTRRWTLVGVAVLAGLSPAALAGRVVPAGLEMGDRASNFVVIPLALAAAAAFAVAERRRAGRREGAATVEDGGDPPRRSPAESAAADDVSPSGDRWRRFAGVSLAATLLGVAAMGGAMLGWGPSWNRLPGPYTVTGDYRSADEWTRAGVDWAQQHIAPGSRVLADRYPATMLSARDRLYPIVAPEVDPVTGDTLEPADIYFSEMLGTGQNEVLQKLHIQYIWVDTRLSQALPHLGNYVYPGENGTGSGTVQAVLTPAQLTKFDDTPGLQAVYRNGPIVIYDTTGAGVVPMATGYTGVRQDGGGSIAFLGGLSVGTALALLALLRGSRLRAVGRSLGPAGVAGVSLATLVLGGAAALGLGFALSPWFGVGFVLPLGVGLIGRVLDRSRPRPVLLHWSGGRMRVGVIVVVLMASGLAVTGSRWSTQSAYEHNVVDVEQLLFSTAGR